MINLRCAGWRLFLIGSGLWFGIGFRLGLWLLFYYLDGFHFVVGFFLQLVVLAGLVYDQLEPRGQFLIILRIFQLHQITLSTLLNLSSSLLIGLDAQALIFFGINLASLHQLDDLFLLFEQPHIHIFLPLIVLQEFIQCAKNPYLIRIRFPLHLASMKFNYTIQYNPIRLYHQPLPYLYDHTYINSINIGTFMNGSLYPKQTVYLQKLALSPF